MQVLISIFQCRPITKFWDVTIAHGKCVNTRDDLLATLVVDFAIGVGILVTPMPYIWNLHQSRSNKVIISGMFLLGGLLVIPKF